MLGRTWPGMVDVIMDGPWMLCGNGWGRVGRYHGWAMDALREWMGSGWTLTWLGHGCSAGTDGVGVDVIMVGPWISAGTDGVGMDVIMVGPSSQVRSRRRVSMNQAKTREF